MFEHWEGENMWLILGGMCSFLNLEFILSHMPYNIGTLYQIYKNFINFTLFINSQEVIAQTYNALDNRNCLGAICDLLPYMPIIIFCMIILLVFLYQTRNNIDNTIFNIIHGFVTGHVIVIFFSIIFLFVEMMIVVIWGPEFNSSLEIKNVI